MATPERSSVLQRKLARARDGAANGARSIQQALRLAVARTASKQLDLPLAAIGVEQARSDLDGLAKLLPDDALLVLMDGPEALTGAVCLDLALTSALVQQQIIGRVSEKPAPERPFTDTDAAMVAPFLEAALDLAAELAQLKADRACLARYRYGARAEDPRNLMLALEADRFRVFDLSVDIGAGLHKGRLMLVLPEPKMADVEPPLPGEKSSVMGETALELTAELQVVLTRLTVPLARLAGMKPGEQLVLPFFRLDRTELVNIEGNAVALCHLGQAGGVRAIRINETLDVARLPHETTETGFAPHPAPAGFPDDAAARLPAVLHDEDDEDDAAFSRMSPEEAAAEISQLAGLPAPEPPKKTEDVS
jgi:flagellar motor switch protein FliM